MTEMGYPTHILVVDDEAGIVLLCERLLGREGFTVQAVQKPHEGLGILETGAVDLLLVDIRMPEMDGFTLIDQARRLQPNMAVVVMTGFGTVETAIEALRRGSDALILKPFSGPELVQTVRRALAESRQKQDVHRLQTLRPLFAITEALFAETNPDHLRELLLDTAIQHLRCSGAGIYQRRTGDNRFQLQAVRGELPDLELGEHDQDFLTRAASSNSPILIVKEPPGEPPLQDLLARFQFSSVMAAPLRAPAAQEAEAVLLAARTQREYSFRESDLEFFAILARQAAVALENARLHDDLRASIRQVQDSQRALVQAEKMAIAGRLTASIAHEINNPLQSVQNCLHLASRRELSLAKRQSYLDMAQNELERLMLTVQRMLDYYRPVALDRKPLALNSLVQRVLLLMEHQLVDHQVEVKTRLSSHLPLVMGVGDQIQQVLLNLILNAVEAMPDGGQLCIETRLNNEGVELLVEDSGPGIDPAERERIFEPFVSTKEGGTGLGLAVSYGIIAAHGGNLELVEERGRGACFRITLPDGDAT